MITSGGDTMTLLEFLKVQRVLQSIAARDGVTVLEVRLSIQEAINEAWANSRTDPAAKAAWDEYFPDGRKPSVEAFIAHLGNRLSAGENPTYLLK